jgi:hypothetical protein
MTCAVFDTYVQKKTGGLMHFDIIVPANTDPAKVFTFGKQYLAERKQGGQALSTKECTFCHIEHATEEVAEAIQKQGYYILEMQGCQ